MKITTYFPLNLPHVPFMPHHARDKIVNALVKDQVGKHVVVRIGEQVLFATISEISHTEDGFTTAVDIPDDSIDIHNLGV